MSLIDKHGKRLLEPGIFEIFVGGHQPDERSRGLTGYEILKELFEVAGDLVELEY